MSRHTPPEEKITNAKLWLHPQQAVPILEDLRCGGPKTPEEIAASTGLDILIVRPQLTHLRVLGNVKRTGRLRRSECGRTAQVLAFVKPLSSPSSDNPGLS